MCLPHCLLARVRYHGPLAPARLTVLDGEGFTLACERALRAIAPGQAVVLYRPDAATGDEVVGGGTIEGSLR